MLPGLLGTAATVLIDTAVPFGWRQLRAQFARVLGGRPLDYIFPTHPEAPHMGNIGPLLQDYPEARLMATCAITSCTFRTSRIASSRWWPARASISSGVT